MEVSNSGASDSAQTARSTLMALGGRTQRRTRRPHAGVQLATGRTTRELLCTTTAYAAAGQHQAAGEGLGAVEIFI